MTQQSLRKIDLHLHLDGSLSYCVLKKLAQENGYTCTDQEIQSAVTVSNNCNNLVEYLKCFELPTLLLQSRQALTLAAFDLITQLEEQGLFYAEIRFAPQLHTQKDLTQHQAVEAVLDALNLAEKAHYKIQIGILLCMMVTGSAAANEETAQLAVAYKNRGVVGLDLAGAEGAVPMSEFQPFFQLAYKNNLPFTIHAGECGDYENISKAISFGARRIGHGCAARFSEACMQLLEKEQIALEMCPTSNLQTKAVSALQEHPIRTFFDRGILVTVNTDNMTVSNTSLTKEYDVIKNQFAFTDADIALMNQNAAKAAFKQLTL